VEGRNEVKTVSKRAETTDDLPSDSKIKFETSFTPFYAINPAKDMAIGAQNKHVPYNPSVLNAFKRVPNSRFTLQAFKGS
jgi:hypothetical protein